MERKTTARIALALAFVWALTGDAAVGFGRATAQSIDTEINDAATADRVPEGVSASDWSGICAAYQFHRHAAFVVDGGYQARNPGQQWLTRFDGRGFLTTPDAGGWSWGLELVSYGRAGAEQSVTTTSCVEADGGRVCYQWDESLTEWYVNDPRGLEHGYTVNRRPERMTGETPTLPTGDAREPPLQLTLSIRGGLRPRVSADGRGVCLRPRRRRPLEPAGLPQGLEYRWD